MEVTMSFLSELPIYKTEKPFDIYREVPAGVPTSNCEFEEHNNIKAQNAREVQSSLGLDITGFKLLKAPSKVDISSIDFQDRASSSIMEYLRETISLVKDELGADRVLCFDWRVRFQFFNSLTSTDNKQLRRRTLTKVELSQQPHNLDYDRFEALETARIVHSGSFQSLPTWSYASQIDHRRLFI
jgi:hypothetical protein